MDVFYVCLNCKNGTKLGKASHIKDFSFQKKEAGDGVVNVQSTVPYFHYRGKNHILLKYNPSL